MRILLPLSILFLTGCSLLPDNSLAYRDAEVIEPLVMADGSPFLANEPHFVVHRMEDRHIGREEGERGFVVPKPPALVVLGADDDDEDVPPAGDSLRTTLTRDGNGFPIVMLYTPFPWAWEYMSQALPATELRVTDRNREVGVFYIRVPERMGLDERNVQLKLSHTTNGIQLAVLNNSGTALVAEAPGLAILQQIHSALQSL